MDYGFAWQECRVCGEGDISAPTEACSVMFPIMNADIGTPQRPGARARSRILDKANNSQLRRIPGRARRHCLLDLGVTTVQGDGADPLPHDVIVRQGHAAVT